MDCVIETEPTEYFVEVEFWEEFPLRKFFTTKWSTHINRQFIYKSDAASPHQGTNRESEKISKWIGRQHWFFVSLSLSLSSLRCEIGCEEFDVLHLRNKTELWQA